MTSLLACAALALASPPVVELPDPGYRLTAVVAVAPLPELSPREQAVLRTLARTIAGPTSDYDSRALAALVAGGERPRMTVLPDHVALKLTVPPQNLRSALGFVESVWSRARVDAGALDRAAILERRRFESPWSKALEDRELPFWDVSREEALEVYRKVFDLRTVVLGVGGEIEPGEGAAQWRRRVAEWTPPRPIRERHRPERRIPPPVPVGLFALELRAEEILARDAALPSRLLAMIALGSGKGSSLHRVAREGMGVSYRQEAILWPTASGWQPRLMLLTNREDAQEIAGRLREELLGDVEAWTEAERERALGMAQAAFLRGVRFHPLYTSAEGPAGAELPERLALATYWRLKTGRDWRPEETLRQMRAVRLEDLQEKARGLLGEPLFRELGRRP